MKGAGALNWPPMIAWFVDSDWQWAFGVCPTYWPAKLYWELEAGGAHASWVALVGVVYLALLSWLMLRRFDRSVHR